MPLFFLLILPDTTDKKVKITMIKKHFFFTVLVLLFSVACMASENTSNSILLVIDMQKDLLTSGRAGMQLDSTEIESLIQNVNKNIVHADSSGIPVAYIQNLWTNPLWIFFGGNVCRKGDKGTEFDKRLKLVNTTIYEKSVPNSFSNDKLSKYIIEHKIKNIFICGIKTEACVSATTKASLRKGYKTFILSPAIGANSLNRLKKDLSVLEQSGAKNIDLIN